LAFGVQPTDAVAGQALSPAVTVQVLDQFDNLVTTDGRDVTLALGSNPGGGGRAAWTAGAASGGVATFGDITVDKTGSGYTLSATAAGVTGADSASFAITPAAADHLVFSQQPTTTVAGQAISPAVTVQVLDQFGNLVTGDGRDVTVALGSNPG